MNYRETFFKQYLRDAGLLKQHENIVDANLMNVLHQIYYMGIARAVEKPLEANKLYKNIEEQHNLHYN